MKFGHQQSKSLDRRRGKLSRAVVVTVVTFYSHSLFPTSFSLSKPVSHFPPCLSLQYIMMWSCRPSLISTQLLDLLSTTTSSRSHSLFPSLSPFFTYSALQYIRRGTVRVWICVQFLSLTVYHHHHRHETRSIPSRRRHRRCHAVTPSIPIHCEWEHHQQGQKRQHVHQRGPAYQLVYRLQLPRVDNEFEGGELGADRP